MSKDLLKHDWAHIYSDKWLCCRLCAKIYSDKTKDTYCSGMPPKIALRATPTPDSKEADVE